MTKQEILNFLKNTIPVLDSGFNLKDTEAYLEDPIREAQPPFEFSLDGGISKAVLLIKGEPYVIKIPFHCVFEQDSYDDAYCDWESARDDYYEEWAQQMLIKCNGDIQLARQKMDEKMKDYDTKYPEPDEGDRIWYTDLEYANDIELPHDEEQYIEPWNYCALETILYEHALEAGLGAYFAEEGFLGMIDETPIYYQQRCIPLDEMGIDYNSDDYKKKKKISDKVCQELDIIAFNDIWVADFIACYGQEELKRLYDFLDEYRIGDLRAANIGYLNGAPILFDYSGYREW